MRAVTAGAFLLITWVATKGLLTPSRISNSLKTDWQRHDLASSGYLELGMLDDGAMALEEIAPEDKTRNEVLGARVNLSPGGQEMGYGRSGCQPSRKG